MIGTYLVHGWMHVFMVQVGAWLMHLCMVQVEVQVDAWLMHGSSLLVYVVWCSFIGIGLHQYISK
jgi:hypothetical protein